MKNKDHYVCITMSYHNCRFLSANFVQSTRSSLIQMQKLDTFQLASKFHGVSHDHPTCLVSLAPTRLQSDRDQRPTAVPANHVFRSITWSPAAMHCNRATFLSHGQGGALLVVKNCINEAVFSSQSIAQ